MLTDHKNKSLYRLMSPLSRHLNVFFKFNRNLAREALIITLHIVKQNVVNRHIMLSFVEMSF